MHRQGLRPKRAGEPADAGSGDDEEQRERGGAAQAATARHERPRRRRQRCGTQLVRDLTQSRDERRAARAFVEMCVQMRTFELRELAIERERCTRPRAFAFVWEDGFHKEYDAA